MLSRTLVAMMPNVIKKPFRAMMPNIIKNTGGDDAHRYKEHWWRNAKRFQEHWLR
jgi:hypothetical protein